MKFAFDLGTPEELQNIEIIIRLFNMKHSPQQNHEGWTITLMD